MKFNFFKEKKPTIIIYGHRGWIGSMYTEYLLSNYPNIKIIKGTSRIDLNYEVIDEINTYKPTHIISFTGRTHGEIDGEKINTIDYLEYPGKLVENVRDNLYGPLTLAILCKEYKIHYTYLGTGCIFNSKNIEIIPDDPSKAQRFIEESIFKYNEYSIPNYFGSGYSVVKGFTDQLMNHYPVLNLRIRMPISSIPNDRNFINKITKYDLICSIPNSMTVLDDFFPIFTDLILKKKYGTYNCTNPGIISHDQILTLYKQIVDPEFTWKNMTLQEQSTMLKSERSNNYLDTSKISKEYPQLKGIHDSIIITLNKLKLRK